MKKSVLFVVTNLGTGGIMRSLQNFLNCYDSSQYDVDVFALTHQGAFNGELKYCTVIPYQRLLDASIARYEYQKGLARIDSLFVKILNKATKYRFQTYLFKITANKLVNKKHYDAVIGFSEGVPTTFVSLMNHPNKIGWIHCDYASYKQLNGDRSELATYQKLQHIVCVSDFTAKSFCSIYPLLTDKTTFIYNIIDEAMMKSKAKEEIEEIINDDCFNILSIGRIDPVKRFSIIPRLAREIKDAGCNIRWYVVGPKGTTDEVKSLNSNMRKYKTEGIVQLLGEKKNPYPYIAKVDLLVNTSVSEACPYVINEAKILRTPVVCSDFGSAKEFVSNGKNGYSVPIEQMADCIVRLIKHPQKLQQMRDNLSFFCYDNEKILKQIYNKVFK